MDDDWKKLVCMMKYLAYTKDLFLTLHADSSVTLKWYKAALFAIHPDMKSHTGIKLTMDKGFPYCKLRKQKLNTKRSTKSELVGVDDGLPQVLWTTYFLKAQGYKTTNTIVYQDNKSAELLEINCKVNSSKRTQHINI